MLPSLAVLERIDERIMSVPNRKKESKRGFHYGCYLLCHKSGLRVNEAIKFDLGSKTKQGLYRIEKPKGKKERFVYIPKKVVRELKKNNWKPNSTNRYNFYHFLKKIKRELNISKSIELSPHTLRRAFTTYQAEKGMPLPLLQKLLGHSSIRTTALYWVNIYQEPANDIGDILVGKKWLDNKRPSNSPIRENFASPKVHTFPELLKTPEPLFTANKPKLTQRPIIKEIPPQLIKQKPAIEPKPHEKKFLAKITGRQSINSQQLTLITNRGEQSTKKEQILLAKIKNQEKQLVQIQTENSNLKSENKHLKMLIKQDKEQTEAKIIQLPPLKVK